MKKTVIFLCAILLIVLSAYVGNNKTSNMDISINDLFKAKTAEAEISPWDPITCRGNGACYHNGCYWPKYPIYWE